MAKLTFSLCSLGFFFCFIMCSSYVHGKTWCVAQTQAPEPKLQEVLDYLCGRINCADIQPGGSCFDPDTVRNHASYAIDMNFRTNDECDGSYAAIAVTDPSYGACVYP
ncbi:hypothetical protein Lser_V15G01672 [Lactuca serriola]|uniref:X8 domain-containing protein n=1 Tax=Lactuca sativa TaxID=4236 RepID=A0A9R1XSR8_LACSA|nr:hypothetical protein LSAT_V11C100017630 [Lactuca sativa]